MSSAGLVVRTGELQDLAQLVEIYNYYVEHTASTFDVEPYTEARRRPWFEQHSGAGKHRMFVAVEGEAVVGYASSHHFRVKAAYDSTVETSVYCAPAWTRRGVGSALYQVLFEALRQEDVATFIAGVTLPNDASLALHARFGFVPVGTMHRVGRKFGRFWDVAWFERSA